MLDNLRRVCLFIGLIVGAGFATGKELIMYFYGRSILSPILAGVFMGVIYAFFLIIGRNGIYNRLMSTPIGKVIGFVMRIFVVMSFVIMCTGANELLESVLGIKYLGVVTGIITSVLVLQGMDNVKNINLIVVPILIILISYLSYGNMSSIEGRVDILSPLSYVGMNMVMGGYIVLEEGEKISNRDILISSLMLISMFSLMLVILTSGIIVYHDMSMPIYYLSMNRGSKYIGGSLIYLSIFTTMLGNAKLIFDTTYKVVRTRYLGVLSIVILSILSVALDFGRTVDIIYRIEGYVGSVFILYLIIGYIIANGKSNIALCNKMRS